MDKSKIRESYESVRKRVIHLQDTILYKCLLKISNMQKGYFIAFEGIDGSGKTDQVTRLFQHLRRALPKRSILVTREPYDGEEIEKMQKEDPEAYSNGTRMTELYVVDRQNHADLLIAPVTSAGGIVLCDRYALSTYAYQVAQGVDFNKIRNMHIHRGIPNPDLTLFLDIDVEIAEQRVRLRGEPLEKFERDREFIIKVIAEYRRLFKLARQPRPRLYLEHFGSIQRIDGNAPKDQVASEIRYLIDNLIGLPR
ncbi:dTMP kinase [Candidatus Pacearchaeota archaeon]|nr:dTMP kinase [Candidatus Pacearchaeota archaeon]